MIEVKVHIYTDGDFILDSNVLLDEEYEYYGARHFFTKEENAEQYIDGVFSLLNSASNPYGQHKNLIKFLHGLRKDVDLFGELVKPLTSAVYCAGNQEIEIYVKKHNKSKEEWWEQRLNDIKEEYFEVFGSYPT